MKGNLHSDPSVQMLHGEAAADTELSLMLGTDENSTDLRMPTPDIVRGSLFPGRTLFFLCCEDIGTATPSRKGR
jgi:hypothetical protein